MRARAAIVLLLAALPWPALAWGAEGDPLQGLPAAATPGARLIDLQTALRLAGARAFEARLAAEAALLAEAQHAAARQRLYPWFRAGAAFRRHFGNVQDIAGLVFKTDKTGLDAGLGLDAQLAFGEARYEALAVHRLAEAAQHASEAQRQDALVAAAGAYLDLVRAQGVVTAAAEARRISEDFARQVSAAANTGIAFKGDAFRASAQAAQDRVLHRQALEEERVAAARLSLRLHLDPSVRLVAAQELPVPMTLLPLARDESAWREQALAQRPELRSSEARQQAAEARVDAAKYAPLYPTLGAAAGIGLLAGSQGNSLDNLGVTGDVALSLSWRFGPGGLFDGPRRDAARSRERTAALESAQLRAAVSLQVAEAFARVQSLADQIESSAEALNAAEETLRLSQQRRELSIGVVAETVLAAQEAARARRAHLTIVAEFNKAQFLLRRAAGEGGAEAAAEARPRENAR